MQSQIGNYAKQCLGQGPNRFRFISRKLFLLTNFVIIM